ncbi:MAG: hypothetical protein ACMG6E_00230, partial [Candidatus Roizmanbacteria bacterium]
NKVVAYILGKCLYEKLLVCLEGLVDREAIEKADFNKGRKLDKVLSEAQVLEARITFLNLDIAKVWKDRKDISNTSSWVQTLRKNESSRKSFR